MPLDITRFSIIHTPDGQHAEIRRHDEQPLT